ncbi:hypothetical protein HDU96_003877 [Phlyctochytrium bullatum]|nr:hypothetical protein HDU96_003877 [Phlyctochytrium bullatum]
MSSPLVTTTASLFGPTPTSSPLAEATPSTDRATSANDTRVAYFQLVTGAIAIYNSLELYALIFLRFKKFDSLYFWSMLVATSGTLLFTAGFFSLFFAMYTSVYEPLCVLTVGWHTMVTGFAVIMYSRLSIVSVPPEIIRYVLYMIVFNYVFSHLPTTFLTFMANVKQTPEWKRAYAIEEKIQMTLFWIQESVLSVIYLIYTRKLSMRLKRVKNRAIIAHTLYMNMFVLLLDLATLLFEYLDLYDYQIMFKAAIYSIKIKSEFAILNILMDVLGHTRGVYSNNFNGVERGGGMIKGPSVSAIPDGTLNRGLRVADEERSGSVPPMELESGTGTRGGQVARVRGEDEESTGSAEGSRPKRNDSW